MLLALDPDDDEASEERGERAKVERRARKDLESALGESLEALTSFGPSDDPDLSSGLVAMEAVHSTRVADVLRASLIESADLGVRIAEEQLGGGGIAFDWTLPNMQARDWATSHSASAVSGITATSLAVTRSSIAAWVENGEPLSALVRELAPFFGPKRAELIASTEVTQAYAQANRMAYRASGVVGKMQWNTANDERVCPICGPLHGTQVDLEKGFDFPLGTPPAHPRCRCMVLPVVDRNLFTGVIAGDEVVEPRIALDTTNYGPRMVDGIIKRYENYLVKIGEAYQLAPEEVDRLLKGVMNEANSAPTAIAFFNSDLNDIINDGRIKTQFEVGSSSAVLDTKGRSTAENLFMGVPENIKPSLRPVYGFSPFNKVDNDPIVENYGDLVFVTKPSVANRTTTTVGDSFLPGIEGRVAAVPIQNGDHRVAFPNKKTMEQVLDFALGKSNTPFPDENYFERQVHGGLALSDIVAVHDPQGKIIPRHKRILENMGIKIYDTEI